MGLLARYLEVAGFSTVVLGTFKMILEAVKPPRTHLVRAPLGKLVGDPHDAIHQTERVKEALALLDTKTETP